MATKRKSDLSLRPIEQRRKPCSPFRCLLWSVILCIGIFAAICIVAVLAFVYSLVAKRISSPFSWTYHRATVGRRPDPSIVRPLVGEGETFDIVASVWVRNGPPLGGPCNKTISESLLFSDTVFRAVSAKDRGLMSNVSFQVPTSIFKQSHLLNFDLRGSFALIPSSSYLLEHAVHSIPSVADNIVVPPVRPVLDETHRTLLDSTVDGYGIHIPLIEFHSVHSRCVNTPITSSGKFESRDQGQKQNVLQVVEEWGHDIQQAARSTSVTRKDSSPEFTLAPHKLVTSNKDLSPLEGHPYIVTRTHLRVVDFTKILNFDKFYENFQKFREQSCHQTIKGTCPNWYLCPEESSLWNKNGLWKTSLIQLGFTAEYWSNNTEWAYAPHMSAVKHATGPKDLIPIPVNREICSYDQTHHDSLLSLPVSDEKMINVTWSITYSGRTPAKMMLGDIVGKIPINPGNNDKENSRNQVVAEYIHGIYGHRHTENSHPRRALALTFIRDAFSACMITIPQLFYWHTRISTAGISVPAAISWTLSDTISSIAGMNTPGTIFSSKDGGPSIYAIFMIWVSNPIFLVKNLLRLMLITRVRVRRRGLLPVVKILPQSHAERSSTRMDAELWRLRILIFPLLTLVYSLIHNPSEGSPSKLLDILSILASSLHVTGSISQIALNFKRRTFACMYKITALCLVISDAEFYINHSSIFLGDSIPSLSKIGIRDYIWTSIVATYLYQALQYPAEEYKDGEE